MRTAIGLIVMAVMLLSQGTNAAGFPLEWNCTWSVDRPYEVEFDKDKIASMTGRTPGHLRVVADGSCIDALLLPGATSSRSVLRFKVPRGTKSLGCVLVDEALVPSDPQTTENLLERSFADASVWKCEDADCAVDKNGLIFTSAGRPKGSALCQVRCPPEARGKPVWFEIELENLSPFAWGGKILVQQTNGKVVLPETVVDSRWISHVRPAGKRFRIRTEGRIHPDAKYLKVEMQLPNAPPEFDDTGMPFAAGSDMRPRLLVSALAMRVGGMIPFPGYSDSFFSEDAEGKGGASLLCDGTNAFWYQTRSIASWGLGRQVSDESSSFYPFGEGTVEAWFKPGWRDDDERAFTLFEAAHDGLGGILGTQATVPIGRMFALEYVPASGTWKLFFRDAKRKEFVGETAPGALRLVSGVWTHVAAQWTPGGNGEVFANGKRILSVALKGMHVLDLANPKIRPNESSPATCRLGASFLAFRPDGTLSEDLPLYVGAVDAWRISSGRRYADLFAPQREFPVDGKTRAFFGFNRSFDGVSGGGLGFIPGSMYAQRGRRRTDVCFGGSTFRYFPETLQTNVNPDMVCNRLNYRNLPAPEDFSMAWKSRSVSVSMKPGATVDVLSADGSVADWIEIANSGSVPLVHPIVLNDGEVDPRSYADIRKTLGLDGLDDQAKAMRIFNYTVGAVDYFGSSQLVFDRGGDAARALHRDALLHLNTYCGFECRQLNFMLSSLFTIAGDMPTSVVAGYRHTYEHVFYDGRNRVYDLSLQRFVPSFANDEVASLGETEDEPGEISRCGSDYSRFIRSGTRGTYADGPGYERKMAITLNPHERFRVWFANDGTLNDLQHRSRYGKSQENDPDDRRRETCGHPKAGGRRFAIRRFDRIFPEFANAFLSFDGVPSSGNPAFARIEDSGFCYKVESAYPVVAGYYRATAHDGTAIPLEISTDGGKTFRPLAASSRIDYPVRARHAYLVRVKASIAEVSRFEAETEVMLNPRVFPGKIRPGSNRFTMKATSGGDAKVSFGWRERGKEIKIDGGLFHGAIPGLERQTVLLEAGGTSRFSVSGASSKTTVRGFGDVRGEIKGGVLILSDLSPQTAPRIAGVEIRDGEYVRTLGVVVSSNARLVSADGAKVAGGATHLRADGDSPQHRVVFPSATPGASARLSFPKLPAGRYQIYLLDRFTSHPGRLNDKPLCIALDNGRRIVDVGSPGARAYNYAKAHYGTKGCRANWKWDVKWEFKSVGSRPESFDMPEFGSIECVVTGKYETVELAGALIVPEPSTPFSCGLVRALLSMNFQPERVRGKHLDGFAEYAAKTNVEPKTAFAVTSNWLQAKIDEVHAKGGGTVVVSPGKWEIPSITLKSGVCLHLPKDVVLLGSTNRVDYPKTGFRSLICAEGARDVSITGEGMIDGRGGLVVKSGCPPPQLINFISCTNVLVEGVSLRNAGSWMLQLRNSFDVTVRNANLYNHDALCNDGIDIASSRVLVEGCTIDTGDDAVVLKTFSPDHVVEDVTVRNCRLATGCNAFKIGTESHGTVRRIKVSNCTISPPSDLLIWKRRVHVPGLTGKLVGSSAIAIESVDGGCVEDIEVKDISGEGVQTPIFIRLGRRRESQRSEPGCIRRVLVENVELKAGSRIACSITGVKGLRPNGIVLRNARLVQRGGGRERDVCVPIPEKENAYPENRMFDFLSLPAYGFYIRHADGVKFENVAVAYEGAREERPAVFVEDATLSVDEKCAFKPSSGKFADVSVYRPSANELVSLRNEYWEGIEVPGGFFAPAEKGSSSPLFVYCGRKERDQLLTAINSGRMRGWNVLLPAENTVCGVLKALDSVKGRYDTRRVGLKADDSGVALALLASESSRWTAVTVCNPTDVPDGLKSFANVSVHIVAGVKGTSFANACAAFNRLAASRDRLSDAECTQMLKDPDGWRRKNVPPRRRGYESNTSRRLVHYRKSGNVHLSICGSKEVNSFSPELDFLSESLDGENTQSRPVIGYMLDISRNKVPTMKTLFRIVDIISELGYNQFQLYMEHTFAYSNHCEIWKDASPMTAEEVRRLDSYCAEKGIDLVPNQNSFGHLENWFRHKKYLPLAEMPEGGVVGWKVFKTPRALCATDQKSIDFMAELYDDLLPNFSSKFFNVGCDEVWELNKRNGKGKSRAKIKKLGAERVWIDYFRKICALAEERGRTVMYWDDMIVRHHPELISELPKNAIALDWGYEVGHSHSFEADCSALAKEGRRFYVCPGTSGWDSISGRHFNMRTNVQEAVSAGLRHGAEGYLMTDWGDGGMCQPWITALPALIYMSRAVKGEWLSDAEIAREVNRICGAKCGESLIRYQNLYLLNGNPHIIGKVLTYKMLSEGKKWKRPAKGMTDADLKALFAERKAARESLDLTGAYDWVADGFATLDVLYDALEMRWRGEHNRVSSECAPRFAQLWLRHNRSGGLDKTLKRVFYAEPNVHD